MDVTTLDIFLFSGQEAWFSTFVEWLTWSEFSHVGIALVRPTYIKEDLLGKYLFESGEEPVPDAVDDKLIFGVQITNLEDLYKGYIGRIYKRTVTTTLTPKEIQDAINNVYHLVYGKKYDTDPLDFLRGELDMRLDSNCRKTNEFFCSAFAGYLMVKLGLIDKDTRWDLLTPKDFASGYKVDKMLKNVGKASYGPLERVK